jgi:hypothetical protein
MTKPDTPPLASCNFREDRGSHEDRATCDMQPVSPSEDEVEKGGVSGKEVQALLRKTQNFG